MPGTPRYRKLFTVLLTRSSQIVFVNELEEILFQKSLLIIQRSEDWVIIIFSHQYWVNNVIGLLLSNNLYCIMAKHNPSGNGKWGLHMWTVGPHLERIVISIKVMVSLWRQQPAHNIDPKKYQGLPTVLFFPKFSPRTWKNALLMRIWKIQSPFI